MLKENQKWKQKKNNGHENLMLFLFKFSNRQFFDK